MERPEDNKWLDEALTETIGSEKPRTDFENWKQQHPDAVKMLTSRAGSHSASKRPLMIRNLIMKSPMIKFVAAAAIIIIVFFSVDYFSTNGSSVAWAEIVEHFESVPFFSITIYAGNDTSTEAKKIEIWKSENSRVRAHQGNNIIFADFADGKEDFIVFDRMTKQPVDDGGLFLVKAILNDLCPEGRFSLDTLINSFPSDDNGLTPVETANTATSRETVVFEVRHKTTPEWILIWALRESKLPMQVRFRDPRSNECSDIFFNYSEKKDDAFFDPEAFTSQSVTNEE